MKKKKAQAMDGGYSLGTNGKVKTLLMFADRSTKNGSSREVADVTLWNATLDYIEIVEMCKVSVTASDTTSWPGGFSVFGDGAAKNQYARVATYSDFYFDSSFFFQAEDGIRDTSVTGVQTCALPI